jgi:hypothetical protein
VEALKIDMKSAGVIDVAERNPPTATVKLDPALVRKAKVVAALRDMKLADYLDRIVRAQVEKDFSKEMPDRADE